MLGWPPVTIAIGELGPAKNAQQFITWAKKRAIIADYWY